MLPRCPTCATLLVEIEPNWHCPGCESALIADARSPVRFSGTGQPCPRCGVKMMTGSLGDASVDRCARHGWCASDELERLDPEPALPRRAIVDAWCAGIAAALPDAHGAGPRLVAGDVMIDLGEEVRIRVAVPALAGTSLKMYFGDARGGDAETGDAAFDRAWRILTDRVELARLLFPAAVRTLCQRTRTVARGLELGVEIGIAQGDVSIAFTRDFDRDRTLAVIGLAQALAARPEAIDGELRAVAAALGGTPRSGAWTWRGGFTATVPCGRAVATLEVADGRARLVAEGSAPVGWAQLVRGFAYRWRTPAAAGRDQRVSGGGRAGGRRGARRGRAARRGDARRAVSAGAAVRGDLARVVAGDRATPGGAAARSRRARRRERRGGAVSLTR